MARQVPKMMAFFVTKYGENHIIKMKELETYYKSLDSKVKETLEPFYVLWGNKDYRIRHGHTVITTSTNPKEICEQLLKNPEKTPKTEKIKETSKLSNMTAPQLAVTVLDHIKKTRAVSKKKTGKAFRKNDKEKYVPEHGNADFDTRTKYDYDYDSFDNSDDDLSDIIKAL